MMRSRTLTTMLVFICAIAPDLLADTVSDRQRDFLRSLELFDMAKSPEEFRESAKVLESFVADGFCNGAVYYNLGNAYYRAGDFGRAILNYRKAKHYLPRDPLLEANLQQALASAPGKIAEPPMPWWQHVMFWQESLSHPARVAIALISSSLAPILAFIAFWFRRHNLLWLAGGMTAMALLFTLDAGLNSPERFSASRAVISGETVARKGIGKDYEAAFDAPLRDGAEFIILNETSGWTFGHFAGIGNGWVRNEFVAR